VGLRLVRFQANPQAWFATDPNPEMQEVNQPLSVLVFPDVTINAQTSRALDIKNLSSIPLKYTWSLSDLDSWFGKSNEGPAKSLLRQQNGTSSLMQTLSRSSNTARGLATSFSISPREGTFQPGEILRFTAVFNPTNATLNRVKAVLSVHGVPASYRPRARRQKISNSLCGTSVQEAVLQEDEESYQRSVFDDTSSIATKVRGGPTMISLPMLEFTLQGQGAYCSVEVSPPI
jgi:hypothetical protein